MKYYFPAIVLLFFSCGMKNNTIVINESPAFEKFTLTETSIKIPQADLDFAVYRDEMGYFPERAGNHSVAATDSEGFATPITPKPIRAPALPVGWLTRSSEPA